MAVRDCWQWHKAHVPAGPTTEFEHYELYVIFDNILRLGAWKLIEHR